MPLAVFIATKNDDLYILIFFPNIIKRTLEVEKVFHRKCKFQCKTLTSTSVSEEEKIFMPPCFFSFIMN